jgi:hypothetical protein
VKVELLSTAGETIHVETSQERYRMLLFQPGRRVYVRPREIKIFTNSTDRGGAVVTPSSRA